MRKVFSIVSFFFLAHYSFSQTPGVRWTKYVKRSSFGQIFYDAKATSDNGYIVAGSDSVFSYNKNQILSKTGGTNPWLIKFDSAGNKIWDRNISGFNSGLNAVVQSADGGFVATGFDQDPAPPYDTSRYHIIKYNSSGAIVWEKLYGGTFEDVPYSIIRADTTGYLVTGYTESNDGDVTGNHSFANADAWLLRINASGNIVWKKCFGGSGHDTAFAAIETPDKGFVVVGSARSSNGDLTGNNGASEAWIFKIDSIGNLIWQKNYGGAAIDAFRNIQITADGNFVVTGYTKSTTATSNGNNGKADVWVAKISVNGDILWSKGFGGTEDDMGFSIVLTQDNSYLVSGFTESNNGDVTGINGLADAWLIKVSDDGNLIWQKCIGTNKNEIAMAVIYHSQNDYSIGGLAEAIAPPGDPIDGLLARLGSTAHIRGNLISGSTINTGLFQAIKSGVQYATIPFNNSFKTDVDTGTYTATYSFPHPYYSVTPSSAIANLPNYFDTATINFTVQPIPGQRDLTISAFPFTAARTGRPVSYKIIYSNVGTDTVLTGTVLFKKDSRINFVSSNPPISSSNADTLKWDYSNFKPFETSSIIINFQIPPPPAVNLNDTLVAVVIITPVAGDLTPLDDTVAINQRVVGSFDPNDKTENFDGNITPAQVADGLYINYVIRFQNTGTDTAFDVTIRDTLDSKLDWNTFQMISASHAYQLGISNQNKISWSFPDIKLVDSFHNESASHGYILYRIKPKTSIVVGDTIKNAASIYFDFNPPVKTNTTKTEVNDHFVLTCPSGTVRIGAIQSADNYQWQVDEGFGFVDIFNSSIYSGSTNDTLILTLPPTSWYGHKYRCLISNSGNTFYSPEYFLKFQVIWDGSSSHDWSSPDNWACGILPDDYTDVVIPSGVTNQPEVNINASCRSLFLQPSSTLIVKPGFRLDIRH